MRYSIYIKHSNCKLVYSDRKQISGYLETRLEVLEVDQLGDYRRSSENFKGWWICLLSWLYFKACPSVQFKYVQCIYLLIFYWFYLKLHVNDIFTLINTALEEIYEELCKHLQTWTKKNKIGISLNYLRCAK